MLNAGTMINDKKVKIIRVLKSKQEPIPFVEHPPVVECFEKFTQTVGVCVICDYIKKNLEKQNREDKAYIESLEKNNTKLKEQNEKYHKLSNQYIQ